MPNGGPSSGEHKAKRDYKIDILALIVAICAALGVFWQGWTISDTEKRQLRAYLGIIPGGVDNFGDPTTQTFNYIVKNYGQTPAYDVFDFPSVPYMIQVNGPVIASPTERPKDVIATFTIFPGREHPKRGIGTTIQKRENDLIASGTGYQLVYSGVIFYKDALGTDHYTRYCFMYKGGSMTSHETDTCYAHNDSN